MMCCIGLLLVALPPPWPHRVDSTPLVERIPPPEGATRVLVPEGSFGAWLRTLPVRSGEPPVLLFDGRPKKNQEAHAFVLDVDVPKKDLQQCADAVMRLYAEHLWAAGRPEEICFHLSSGAPMPYRRWMAGERPTIRRDGTIAWERGARPGSDRALFGAYLERVFMYAGSASLAAELEVPSSPVEPGDVFIRGGHPGHAVIVLDVAVRGDERLVLLAQSFMPAQDIQVLRAAEPDKSGDRVWVRAAASGVLKTPEWTFDWADRRRFAPAARAKACIEAHDRQP